MTRKQPQDLRSHRWYGLDDMRSFIHHSRTKQMGFAHEDYVRKPIIAIVSTFSDINPCHHHFKSRVKDVNRGVYQAGGFPLEMPTMSLGEPFMKPTAMLYRNLLSIDVEGLLRVNPVDGAVLLGGCDKTVPAMLMGAASMNLLRQGVRDMVRISDARMSGTSYGARVLHVAPESAVGGPLALLRDGDIIELDVTARKLKFKVSIDELTNKAGWKPKASPYPRGFGWIHIEHVTQANEGCDFDFLRGATPVPEPGFVDTRVASDNQR